MRKYKLIKLYLNCDFGIGVTKKIIICCDKINPLYKYPLVQNNFFLNPFLFKKKI